MKRFYLYFNTLTSLPVFFLLGTFYVFLGAKALAVSKKEYRILLDPGHGGSDTGALGLHQTVEKHVCNQLTDLVEKALLRRATVEKLSLSVRRTRSADLFMSLMRRVQVANDWNADVFVSVHANSSTDPKVRGYEVYFLSSDASDEHSKAVATKENQKELPSSKQSEVLSILADVQINQHVIESSRLAEKVYEAMAQSLVPNIRGVRQGPFTVLFGTEMPAILVEIGYLTNKVDSKLLRSLDYLKFASDAISSGIFQFLKEQRHSFHASKSKATK